MQEGQVTVGDETLVLPEPFWVLATQNPIEQEGTYPLPEAQLDRFLMRTSVGYPDRQATSSGSTTRWSVTGPRRTPVITAATQRLRSSGLCADEVTGGDHARP